VTEMSWERSLPCEWQKVQKARGGESLAVGDCLAAEMGRLLPSEPQASGQQLLDKPEQQPAANAGCSSRRALKHINSKASAVSTHTDPQLTAASYATALQPPPAASPAAEHGSRLCSGGWP